MQHLATFFDKNYLSRGIVLYQSLSQACSVFKLYVLCLDETVLHYFEEHKAIFPHVITIGMEELERDDQDLLACKKNRSKIEYYFTISPCLPLYLLNRFQLPHICTLDADILFLSPLDSVFDNLTQYSIIITPHKFSKQILSSEKYGKFNVSFQIFKNDEIGLKCLHHWRKQCIEWCYDQYDEKNDRFADQKYLDSWPQSYGEKLLVLDDDVCGLAAWNLNNYVIARNQNQFLSNGRPIIFYHFHNFKILGKNWAANGFDKYKVVPSDNIHYLYLHYWNLLESHNQKIGSNLDFSERTNLSGNLGNKLNNERFVYFKLFSKNIFYFDYLKMPELIRKIIYKLNG